MKNFPIIDSKTGREYWISRSVAVIVIVFAYDLKGKQYVLTVRRGNGTPLVYLVDILILMKLLKKQLQENYLRKLELK